MLQKRCYFDSDGLFLLLTRSDTHPTLAGFYDLPGGTLEQDEEPGVAVVREVREETGFDLPQTDVTLLYTTTQLLHGKSYPTMLYLARLSAAHPAAAISWEHSAYEWAPIERLGEVEPHFAPTYREALDYIRVNTIIEDINE